MPFLNRQEAGQILSRQLINREFNSNSVILALPRGGVPIAFEIARQLKIPLDILVTRKIGAPNNPEFGIGAITEEGFYWIDENSAQSVGATKDEIHQTITQEGREVIRRINRYRHGRPRIPIEGRTVILVDDGLATGVTARVAAHYLKEKGAKQIILAIPVCSPRTANYLRSELDEVICLEEPESFFSVGQFYEDFNQVSDEEVISLLSKCSEFSMQAASSPQIDSREVTIAEGKVALPGNLTVPISAKGLIIFAHGSGSSRLSPRNRQVANTLNEAGLATLLFDLLTEEESINRSNVFDIPLLANRLILATQWVRKQGLAAHLPIGYFGASTGAGAALWAAAELGPEISAVVSRGGRPDLAISRLKQVTAPTLLIVGGFDEPVIEMNREALKYLATGNLVVVPGATHLFEEPGTLEAVARHAVHWFISHLEKGKRNEAA